MPSCWVLRTKIAWNGKTKNSPLWRKWWKNSTRRKKGKRGNTLVLDSDAKTGAVAQEQGGSFTSVSVGEDGNIVESAVVRKTRGECADRDKAMESKEVEQRFDGGSAKSCENKLVDGGLNIAEDDIKEAKRLKALACQEQR
jgi:hypothetical protein